MADYAFPELHSRSKGKKEPENLLILTRTRVDKHGRRHSVAVPLVPPPDGEKFEGGYHMERNPITGGAKLVPPASEWSSIFSRSWISFKTASRWGQTGLEWNNQLRFGHLSDGNVFSQRIVDVDGAMIMVPENVDEGVMRDQIDPDRRAGLQSQVNHDTFNRLALFLVRFLSLDLLSPSPLLRGGEQGSSRSRSEILSVDIYKTLRVHNCTPRSTFWEPLPCRLHLVFLTFDNLFILSQKLPRALLWPQLHVHFHSLGSNYREHWSLKWLSNY